MNPPLNLLRICFVILFCSVGLDAPGVSAQDAAAPGAPHLLPQDTLLYARLDSADDLRVDLRNSSIGRMLNDPKMKGFSNDLYATLQVLFEQISDEVGVSLDELLSIPSGQVSAAAMPAIISVRAESDRVDEPEDDSPEAIRRRIARKRRQQNGLAGLFLVEAGDNVDKLRAIVDRLEQRLLDGDYVRRVSSVEKTELVRLLPPRPGRPEVEYFQQDGTIVLGIGHQTAAKVLDQWLGRSDEPTLADNVDFASVMARCVGAEETRPQLTFYADPYHFVERLVKRGGAAGIVWPIIEELGVAKIRGVGGSTFRGGDAFEEISHLHLLIDPPRDGIFGVLRPAAGQSRPPKWVPSDVTSYTTIHWDFEQTYDNLDKILAKFQGPEPLKRLLEDKMKSEVGIDAREELLGNLTGRYVVIRWMQRPVSINSNTQIHALELNDPAAAKATIARLRERKPNALQVESMGGSVVYVPPQRNRNRAPRNFRRPEPCATIYGNWIIGSDSREFLQRAVRAGGGALPRLADVPEYDLISSELGGKLDGEQPFMVSFLRGSEYVRQVYELAKADKSKQFLRSVAQGNVVARKFAELLDRNELPPYEEFEKYFAPSGTFAYDEATGMHLGSFTLKADD